MSQASERTRRLESHRVRHRAWPPGARAHTHQSQRAGARVARGTACTRPHGCDTDETWRLATNPAPDAHLAFDACQIFRVSGRWELQRRWHGRLRDVIEGLSRVVPEGDGKGKGDGGDTTLGAWRCLSDRQRYLSHCA